MADFSHVENARYILQQSSASNRVEWDTPMNTLHRLLAVLAGFAMLAQAQLEAPPTEARANGVFVETGIDVLLRENFAPLEGRRVGLITNHTGVDRSGVSTVRRLHDAPNVTLVALFSPEHGLHGKLDIPEIADSEDGETGLRVFSLYGETRKPAPAMLEGIDTLVFDIQDIGTRFYTYISTMGLALEAAAENGIRFVVLDRPNPINGVDVTGPVADPDKLSFTAWHRLPVRHGMTAGELALMFRAERSLDLDLQVIELENWDRSGYFDATGLRWINPSPNMRSLTQALLYPGIGLLETTNLSVGRGTDTPFEVVGAPWLDGQALADVLNRMQLPGVVFVPVDFTPDSSKFAGERCSGVNIIITNRPEFDPLRTGFEIARVLRLMYADDWDAEAYARLLANGAVFEAVRAGQDIDAIEAVYREERDAFVKRRQAYLLYP
jgi:uncharacterized protein YbbC (DUF1343 family)